MNTDFGQEMANVDYNSLMREIDRLSEERDRLIMKWNQRPGNNMNVYELKADSSTYITAARSEDEAVVVTQKVSEENIDLAKIREVGKDEGKMMVVRKGFPTYWEYAQRLKDAAVITSD